MAQGDPTQFAIDMRKLTERFKDRADDVVRRAILDIGRALVERSPVGDPSQWKYPDSAPEGYVGGTFRNSWQYGRGSIPNELGMQRPDPGGAASLASINLGSQNEPAGHVHYLINNLPYGPALEYGHSKQAPAGMVRIVAVEFEDYMTRILQS